MNKGRKAQYIKDLYLKDSLNFNFFFNIGSQ